MSLEQQLKDRLAQLSPTHLEVVNESSGHGGYFPGKESHFKTVIVSQAFAGLRPVQRHQKFMLLRGSAVERQDSCAGDSCILPEEWTGQDTSSPACAHAPKTKRK